MPNYYIYLISSLPTLHFGARPPFSFEKLVELCKGLIPDEDQELIRSIPQPQELAQSTLKKWVVFDTELRNELAKIRASRKHLDPAKYMRRDGYAEPSTARIAMSAYRSNSILEAERMLDEARWHALDEIIQGHYFDIDYLIAYACKLLILERWERIRLADKPVLTEAVLSGN